MSFLNDNQMRQHLLTAFGVPEESWSDLDKAEDVLAWAEKYAAGISMPFDLVRDVRVCYDRYPVEQFVLNPRPNNPLFKVCEETEYPWTLVSSSLQSGLSALFFVQADSKGLDELPGADKCLECFKRSTSKDAMLLFGRRYSLIILAASLTTFITDNH